MQKCYDCGHDLPTPEQRKAGFRHACVVMREPEEGTTFELERYKPDYLTGSYSVDILKDGKTVVGLISSRHACEQLLNVRGFKGPFVWPSIAQSEERRKARRRKQLPLIRRASRSHASEASHGQNGP